MGAGLLNMPIHKPHRRKKKKNALPQPEKSLEDKHSKWEQTHRQADVSMQKFGKRPDSVEKTLNACFLKNVSVVAIYGKGACCPIVCWLSPPFPLLFVHLHTQTLFFLSVEEKSHKKLVHKTKVSIESLIQRGSFLRMKLV